MGIYQIKIRKFIFINETESLTFYLVKNVGGGKTIDITI